MRRAAVFFVLATCLLGGCTASSGGSEESSPRGVRESTPVVTPGGEALRTPRTYDESCARQPQICATPRPGAVPSALWRDLRFPAVTGRCPVTGGATLAWGLPFGGTAVGEGPVRAVVGGDAWDGVLRLWPDRVEGWYGAKTLWFADPAYTGPVLLRGRRLNAPGEVAFGEGPHTLAVQIPAGRGVNVVDGYRHWPGATWVREPGCYGLQADGTTFSVAVVVDARLPG
ncbi:hypothetical protein [Actinopolymorpha pittospori]